MSHHLDALTSGPGWAAFADPAQYTHAAIVLVLATVSGLLLAHHPARRGRPMSIDDLEEQKTLVVYSSVGALIAIICTVAPSMAFVIFGIGGLMRFRTTTKGAKATGHTIMGTLVGLCWGLGLELVAVLATLYFWLMIYFLEGNPAHALTVFGLPLDAMPRAAEAYRTAFTRAGCKVIGYSKSFKKGKLELVLRAPTTFTSEDADKAAATIPEELRGNFDWQD